MSEQIVDIEAESERIAEITDPSERLVRSGVLALIRSGRAVLDGGLSPDLVARTAQRSRRSYYDHFRGKADFTDRLIDDLLGVGGPTPTRIDVVDNLIDTNTGDLGETMRTMAQPPRIDNTERVNRIGRQIVTALAANDPYARGRINDFYARDQLVYEPLVAQLFASWGLEFRPPWDHVVASVVFRILVDGVAMRAMVDESVDEFELLLLVLNTLLPAISKLADSDDNDDVDDLIRSMSDQARYHLRERQDPALVVDSRKAIHEAAMKEITSRGLAKTTLFDVASSAQLSVRTVRRAVGELDDIVCDMLNGYIGGLDNAVEVDLDDMCAGDPWQATVRHLSRASKMMSERSVLTQALSSLAVAGESEAARRTIKRLDDILFRLLRAAAEAGQFEQDLTEAELRVVAHSGVRLIFRSTISDPADCAEDALFVLSRCCGAAHERGAQA